MECKIVHFLCFVWELEPHIGHTKVHNFAVMMGLIRGMGAKKKSKPITYILESHVKEQCLN